MKVIYRILYWSTLVLALLSTAMLVFNMAAIPLNVQEIFVERSTISSAGELGILIGFCFMPVFNSTSLVWIFTLIRWAKSASKGDLGIMALGMLCLILFWGEKVMVDEIGRETLLGWEVAGEWIILYVFLVIQLLYNIIILLRLYHARRTEVPL